MEDGGGESGEVTDDASAEGDEEGLAVKAGTDHPAADVFEDGDDTSWWALSIGACYGGNLTLIAASANLVASGAETHVSELTFVYHPGEDAVMGYGVAIGMGLDFFEYYSIMAALLVHRPGSSSAIKSSLKV